MKRDSDAWFQNRLRQPTGNVKCERGDEHFSFFQIQMRFGLPITFWLVNFRILVERWKARRHCDKQWSSFYTPPKIVTAILFLGTTSATSSDSRDKWCAVWTSGFTSRTFPAKFFPWFGRCRRLEEKRSHFSGNTDLCHIVLVWTKGLAVLYFYS